MHELGYNYRITDFQCALGSNQLKKLDHFVERRREISKIYNETFYNVDSVKIPKNHISVEHSYHLYPLQINFEKLNLTKSEFFRKMKKVGINLQVHYIPVHLQPFYRKNFGFQPGDFPVAEDYYRREASLPIYPKLSNDDQDQVIESVIQNLNE